VVLRRRLTHAAQRLVRQGVPALFGDELLDHHLEHTTVAHREEAAEDQAADGALRVARATRS
jgi:hypothetical protein